MAQRSKVTCGKSRLDMVGTCRSYNNRRRYEKLPLAEPRTTLGKTQATDKRTDEQLTDKRTAPSRKAIG